MMFVFLCFRRRQNLFRCWCVMEAEYLREIAGKAKRWHQEDEKGPS